MDRHPVSQRQGGDAVRGDGAGFGDIPDGHVPDGHVPDVDILRESLVGGDVGVGLVQRSHEHVVAVRRGVHGHVAACSAQRFDTHAANVDQCQLGGGIVVEHVFIMLVAECVAVFIGGALAGFAVRLLNAGADRYFRLGRWRAHVFRHQLDQQGFLVRHPLQFTFEHRVQLDAGHALDGAGLAVAYP